MITTSHSQFRQIKDILEQLDEGCLERSADERRGAPRVNVRTTLEAIVLSGTSFSPIQIYTRNLSSGGVGFVSRRLLTEGQRIVISLSIAKRPTKLILSQVTFGRYVGLGMYEMGAQFLEAVDDPEGEGAVPLRWTHKAKQDDRAGVGAERGAAEEELDRWWRGKDQGKERPTA